MSARLLTTVPAVALTERGWGCAMCCFALLLAAGSPAELAGQEVRRTAAIHWRHVPLRDALSRLQTLFDEPTFVDRRVDPNVRVSLDLEASSTGEVLNQLAASQGLGASRLGPLLYLGPLASAEQLPTVAALRLDEIRQLPRGQRTPLTRKRPREWPRLSEPRELATSIVEQAGWRIEHAEQIPHDLWPAAKLPPLTLAEQLTLLLIGFDLTFELRPSQRAIAVVPLRPLHDAGKPQAAAQPLRQRLPARAPREQKQVYTLRVKEQPVRAVLRELTQRLNWPIDVDDAAVRAAGHSLDERVSFTVENADQDTLLDALLRPARLNFRRDGERIIVIPRDGAQ